jgi:hypothetical protein
VDGAADAVAEALAYGWEHWDRVSAMENPLGYLYRVGQSRSRPRSGPLVLPPPGEVGVPEIEPALVPALLALGNAFPGANPDAKLTAWYDAENQLVWIESAGGWRENQEFTESYWGRPETVAPSPAGCQPQVVFVDGRALIDRCDRIAWATGGEIGDVGTWVGNARLASTGSTVLEWRSTGNEAHLRLWVP